MAGDAATRALALLHGEGIDTTMEETERLVQRQRELARERATLRAELHSAKRRSTRTLDKARGLTDQQPPRDRCESQYEGQGHSQGESKSESRLIMSDACHNLCAR